MKSNTAEPVYSPVLNTIDPRCLGIPSKKVFCSLTCPEPATTDGNILHYNNMYEAFRDGLTPCPVCHPDLSADRIIIGKSVSPIVNRAIELINDGYLNTHNVSELSSELNVSERHLRRIFMQELGFSPTSLSTWYRTVFAKRLLLETSMSVTDIAYASGFGSIRQFNEVFREIYRAQPRAVRSGSHQGLRDDTLYIEYEEGFDFADCLSKIKARSIEGVELITDSAYMRTFHINGSAGHAVVTNDSERSRLRLEIKAENRNCYLALYHKIRRMFDIGMDEGAIRAELGTESFGGYLSTHRVPRLLLWFNPLECLHYALLCQDYTHEEAKALMVRYVKTCGSPYKCDIEGLNFIYPEKIGLSWADQIKAGYSGELTNILSRLEQAVNNNKVVLAYNQTYRDFRRSMMSVEGILEPTANYMAMFGLGMKNAYTYARDWLISLNLEQWNNYRSYAAMIYDLLENAENDI